MNKHLLLLLLLLTVYYVNAKKVEFAVDMTGQTVSPNGVHVAGDFQDEAGYEGGDWQSNTTLMTNETGTAIYSVVVDIPAFAKYEFKFINGDQWYEVEFVPLESRVGYDFNDNRWVYVDSVMNDTTKIQPVLFSGNAPAGYYLLRLKVDLSQEESIDPAGIHAAQDEQLGTTSSAIMYAFVEDVYELIVYAPVWTDHAECLYSFINGNTPEGYETVPQDCSVDGYRFIELEKDSVSETVCFSECSACDPQFIITNDQPAAAKVYPNPLETSSVLDFNDGKEGHRVILTDMLGNTARIYETCQGPSLTISRDNLKEGIYFIRIADGKNWLGTLRLIISHE